jgi:uridine kinase
VAVNHSEWPDRTTRPLVIGIAGGSGSGKTTIAHAVVDAVPHHDVAFLEHDAYYRDQRHLPFEERTATNYDHPDSLETDLLVRHIADLRAGRAIEKPVYDFSTHTRTDRTIRVTPTAVVVVEGILVLVEPALRDAMDLRIYVDTDADLRLMRRLERDIEERGRTLESVMHQYLSTVRPMHLQFVEPSKRYADIIIPEGYNVGAVGTVTSMIRDYLTSV